MTQCRPPHGTSPPERVGLKEIAVLDIHSLMNVLLCPVCNGSNLHIKDYDVQFSKKTGYRICLKFSCENDCKDQVLSFEDDHGHVCMAWEE